MYVKEVSIVLMFYLATLLVVFQERKEDLYVWIPLEVTATAYNSLPSQTTEMDPNVAAWGDTLKPGLKSIAVSRDLIAKGLKHRTMVRIDAFPDTFLINDKMNRRWNNRIDIYMGTDVQKAKTWGKMKVCIEYAVLKSELDSTRSVVKKKIDQ